MKNKLVTIIKNQYTLAGIVLVVVVVLGVVLIKNVDMFAADKNETQAVFFENTGYVSQGTVQAKEVSINSKLPGRIMKIYVSEGDKVTAGDKLVEISSDELVAKKEQAQAAIAQAEAGLNAGNGQLEQAKAGVLASEALVKQAKAGVASSEALVNQVKAGIDAATGKVKEAEAGLAASENQQQVAEAVAEKANNGARQQEVSQAQAAYDLMKSTYERVLSLEEKGAVSKQKLEEVKTQLDVSEQTLSMAKEGARNEDKMAAMATNEQAKSGVTVSETRIEQANAAKSASEAQLIQAMAGHQASEAQLTQAMAGLQASKATLSQAVAGVELRKAQIEQAKAALKEVEAYLKDTIILAPESGVITAIHSNEGELVNSGTSIGSLSNMSSAWVLVNVKETDLSNISENEKVNIKFSAYPDEVFNGKVLAINKQPDFAIKRATNQNGAFDIVSYGVKVVFDESGENGKILAGMTAFVDFIK